MLADALAAAFCGAVMVPEPHHHTIKRSGADGLLSLTPAWTNAAMPSPAQAGEAAGGRFLGCKIATDFPDNTAAAKPSRHARYLLFSADSGKPLAIMDGGALAMWRTAATSALAARYLARGDAAHLVMVGAGALAPHLVRAHVAMHPITRVTLWNRSRARAVSTAFALAASGIETEIAENLEEAVHEADIVCCATFATAPLVRGAWLKPGTHVDLVGSVTPQMREADDQLLKKARIYVDARETALKESGELTGALKRRVIKKADIQGDIAQLCRNAVKGRKKAAEITLFKSTGIAAGDLAAAIAVWQALQAPPHQPP